MIPTGNEERMRYDRVITGTFVNRPNRFVAVCMLGSDEIAVHVKNTGRCRELLVPGARVVLSESDNHDRKYRYDLVAVYKGDLLVNMDSQAPNTVFMEWLESEHPFGSGAVVHQEYTHGDSRFDFMVESPDGPVLIEVKGVTLENDGFCRFPDAPTERGAKHLRGLRKALEEGYRTYVAFVIQMEGMKGFGPNRDTDPVFSSELDAAVDAGVGVLCLGCHVEEDSVSITHTVPFIRNRRPRSSWIPRDPSPRGP